MMLMYQLNDHTVHAISTGYTITNTSCIGPAVVKSYFPMHS